MAEKTKTDFNNLLTRLSRRRMSVRFAEPADVELSCDPVFVLASARSGSTLLRLILDSHSRICCPPENNFFIHLAPLMGNRFASEGLRSMGFTHNHVCQKLRELVVYFYENYARSTGKPRWADKSGGTAYHAEFIHELLPEAKFVILLRHPLDVANSCSKLSDARTSLLPDFLDDTGNLFVAGARYWKDIVAPMIRFRDGHGDCCHTVHYERLCEDPEPTLRGLFDFLGEPWEPGVMRVHDFKHDVGIGDTKVYWQDEIHPNSRNYLHHPADVIARAHDAAEPLMSQLGYQV